MKENYFDKIELQSGTLMELLMSLLRIGMNNRYHELSKEYGLAIDEEIDSWVNEVLNTISTPMKDLLEFYFNDDGFLGLGLLFIVNELREQKNFENLIAYIEKLSPEKIGNYLLRFACEDKWRDDFFIFQHDEKLFDIITTYFSVSDEGKWRVFKILSKPKLIKKELLSLLRYYYNTFYKQKQSEVDQLINQCITHNEEKLKQSFINSLLPVLSKKITTDIFKERNPLIVHVSYFLEFGSSFFLENKCLFIGYRYPEMVQIWGVGSQGLLSKLSIFKVLADETRLKILLQMNQGPKYLTEMADSLGFSTPAIKYHLE